MAVEEQATHPARGRHSSWSYGGRGAVAVSPDGARVAFSVSAAYARRASGRRATSGRSNPTGPAARRPAGAAPTRFPRGRPDGTLAFASDRDHAGRMRCTSSGPGRARRGPSGTSTGSVEHLSWSPDGRRLLVLAADLGADRAGIQAATKIQEAGRRGGGSEGQAAVRGLAPPLRDRRRVRRDRGGRPGGRPRLRVRLGRRASRRDLRRRADRERLVRRLRRAARPRRAHRRARLRARVADPVPGPRRRQRLVRRGLLLRSRRPRRRRQGGRSRPSRRRDIAVENTDVSFLARRDDDRLWFAGLRGMGSACGSFRRAGEVRSSGQATPWWAPASSRTSRPAATASSASSSPPTARPKWSSSTTATGARSPTLNGAIPDPNAAGDVGGADLEAADGLEIEGLLARSARGRGAVSAHRLRPRRPDGRRGAGASFQPARPGRCSRRRATPSCSRTRAEAPAAARSSRARTSGTWAAATSRTSSPGWTRWSRRASSTPNASASTAGATAGSCQRGR